MADVTKGSSSQIDEVSSTDGPPVICEPTPVTTNGDSESLDQEEVKVRHRIAVVSSSTSVKPRSFFLHRTNVLGSSDATSSSSVSTGTGTGSVFCNRGFVLNPPRLSESLKVDSDEESIADESKQPEVSSSPSKAEAKSKGFVLNPPRLSNPFAKVGGDDDWADTKSVDKQSEVTSTPTKAEEGLVSSMPKSTVSFVPLGGEPSTPAAPPSLSQTSSTTAPSFGFVFGQNIHEKVVEATTPAEATTSTVSENSNSQEEPKEVTTNGTTAASEMLFSIHAKKEADKAEKALDSGGKTLREAAREYEEARAVKRKFEEVQVITGEEEESNVLQINCKLFSWSSSTWVERGRGTLRVNDVPSNTTHHRLIVRSAGSLRVVLNTNIWSGMTVDRASNKSMRITAMDSNEVVKVFLIMASPKEMDQLQKCLEWRVNNLKKNEPENHKKVKGEEKPLPPALDDKLYTY